MTNPNPKKYSDNWGGRRDGAGAPKSWNLGKTTTVRIPIALKDQILDIARRIDEGDLMTQNQLESVTETINNLRDVVEKWKAINNEQPHKAPQYYKVREMLKDLESVLNQLDSDTQS